MQKEVNFNIGRKVSAVPNGKIVHLDSKNDEDLQFIRETYGYETEEKGWFREMDRLFLISGALTGKTAQSKLRGAPPPGILEVPMPPLPEELLFMLN